jgi:DNA-binding NtrC family response regulator
VVGLDRASAGRRLEALRALSCLREDRITECAAVYGRALLDREAGHWIRAAHVFEEARRLSSYAVDETWCLYRQAEALIEIESPGEVLDLCARALRRARRSAPFALVTRIRLLAVAAYQASGATKRAWQTCDRIRATPGVLDQPLLHSTLRLREADLLHEAGRNDAALAACRDAEDLLQEGPAGGAEARKTEAWTAEADRPDEEAQPLVTPLSILRRRVEILMALARWTEAHTRAMQAMSLGGSGSLVDRGLLYLLQARLLFRNSEENQAWEALRRGEGDLRAVRACGPLAQLLVIKAEAVALRLDGSEKRRVAREGLFEARAILRRLGREKLVGQCDLLLETIRTPPGGTTEQPRAFGARRPPRVPRMRRLSQLGFLTADPRILRSLEPVESLARTTIPVLVLGESGTGKEVLARALHRATGGRGPFIGVNCGALPSELQESELFGHVRGAFTGAVADKIGLFEASDGGTLLLDEIGEMSPRAQVKLLRVLELDEVRRVGEIRSRKIRVRVIAATNADLETSIRKGDFRRDLYYRLCGLKVELPPLRDRLGDVPLLSAYFASLFGNHGETSPSLSSEALDLLLQHSWPGNVRELRFAIEKAVALTRALGRDQVEADCIDIHPERKQTQKSETDTVASVVEIAAAGGLDTYLENIERRLIVKSLEENGWNRTRAARALGDMSRTTLIGKMKRLGLFPGPGEKEELVSEGA